MKNQHFINCKLDEAKWLAWLHIHVSDFSAGVRIPTSLTDGNFWQTVDIKYDVEKNNEAVELKKLIISRYFKISFTFGPFSESY